MTWKPKGLIEDVFCLGLVFLWDIVFAASVTIGFIMLFEHLKLKL